MPEEITSVAPPAVREQLDWLLAARAPLQDEELRLHLAPSLVDASGGPEGVNAALASVGPLALRSIVATSPDRVQAAVSGSAGNFLLTVGVSTAGLVDDLQLTPDETAPASWTEIDRQLSGLGARVAFAAARLDPDGGSRIIHGVDAETRRPLGSAFKLYVLGALAQAVAEGQARWDEPLTIRDDWKSLPSGTLQNQPAGVSFPLAHFAGLMMSISDNTAADHLIHRLGRDAVQRQLTLSGHSRPEANEPFLTTRALFQLKAGAETARAQYLELQHADERAAAVIGLEELPLPEVRQIWPRPVNIDEIEWFASPADICRLYAGLLRANQPEVHHALSRNDDGLNLDGSRFPAVWYKGGSEPGVVTLHYLARTADGRALAVSLMVSDPLAALDTVNVAVQAQSIIRRAFQLAAGPQ